MRFIRKIIPGSGDRPITGNGIGLSTASLLCAVLVAGAMLFSSIGCSEKKAEVKHFESLIIAELRSDLGYDLKLTEPLPPTAEQSAGTAGAVAGKVSPGKTGDTSTPLDPEYRAMQRFEVPPTADKHLSLNIQAPAPEEDETITTRDKKLVFGGKGFETQEFESHSKEKMNINYHTYVYSPPEETRIF